MVLIMEYQWVQEFLSSPQLADIISYICLIGSYIALYFVKKFVKRDNKNTISNVDLKAAKLNAMQAKLEASDKKHEEEREEWKKEKQELISEIEELKVAVRMCASNSNELVKKGISNQVSKMLPVEDGNIVVETEKIETESVEEE